MFQIKDYLNPAFEQEENDAVNPFAANAAGKADRKAVNPPDIKVQVSGSDFIVTRTTKQTKKTLVCIASKKLMFIRDEKTNQDVKATPELLKGFMGNTERIDLIDGDTEEECAWISHLEKPLQFARDLLELFENYNPLIVKGQVYFDNLHYFGYRHSSSSLAPRFVGDARCLKYIDAFFRMIGTERRADAAAAFGKMLLNQDAGEDAKFTSALSYFMDVEKVEILDTLDGWGLSGTMEFLNEFLNSPIEKLVDPWRLIAILCDTPEGSYYVHNRYNRVFDVAACARNARPFKRRELQDYILYRASAEDGDESNGSFCDTYSDYLHMRDDMKRITAKEYDLYPENLFSAERKMASVHRKYSKELERIADEEWAEYVKFMQAYEYKATYMGTHYVMVAPRTKADMLEEATSQHNCLSSYISRVKNGECMIFFCRKASAPDKSYCTVEVRSDGTLGQVKMACNREPDSETRGFVELWHKKFFGGNAQVAATA